MAKPGTSSSQTSLAIAAQLQAGLEKAALELEAVTATSFVTVSPSSKRSGLIGAARTYLIDQLYEAKSAMHVKQPEVSIVIPVFNKVEYTLACLESLSKHWTRHSFEVIVVDNASSDQTRQIISSIPGIRYVRNDSNLGFVEGCNVGAARAKGKNLVFLNNDTVVMGNWLDALINRLDDETIGLVGSKLIYPDGALQDAGGIIFSDGSGHNYGKGHKADEFEFNFARDVDYVTGASMALSKQLFDHVGGFDMRYAPAYYEDTDLAMSVWASGKRVVYEPYSVVTHIEGGTAGTDTGSGFKRYQMINQKKFVKKWAKTLKSNHYPSSVLPELASRYGKPKRLLIIDSIVPEPNHDAGSMRMRKIVKAAQELGYAVTLLPDNLVASMPYTEELQGLEVEVVYGKLSIRDFYKHRLDLYDVVLLSRPLTAIWHVDLCRAFQPHAKLIYDTVDLHFVRTERQAAVEKNQELASKAAMWKAIEFDLMDKCDVTIVVSTSEKELLAKEKPGLRVEIIPTINDKVYNPAASPGFEDRTGVMFIGSSHPPNEDAAVWFVDEIFPLVLKEIPALEFNLLGSNPSERLKNLASYNIKVPGFLEDVGPSFDEARIFVCPMRFGAGIKGKLSQAMSYGLPIVTTSIGAEGMHLEDGKNCLIADSAKEFAKKTIKLYGDRALWTKLQGGALKTFDEYFSEAAGKRALDNAIKNS